MRMKKCFDGIVHYSQSWLLKTLKGNAYVCDNLNNLQVGFYSNSVVNFHTIIE